MFVNVKNPYVFVGVASWFPRIGYTGILGNSVFSAIRTFFIDSVFLGILVSHMP